MFVPRRSLPPRNAVRAFEAAARLGSFKEAAAELSVTHGAVSQQIRLLEEWLGAPSLFRLSVRRVVLTPAGAAFLGFLLGLTHAAILGGKAEMENIAVGDHVVLAFQP